ncbi:MAG: hypothetical protein GQ574_13800 [Crocinitomix sp.]|nr:hypothetical protein [Crocinitomix sp.]
MKISALIFYGTAIAFVIKIDSVRAEMRTFHASELAEATDSIIVHFTHGSTVNEGCEFAKPTLGGYYGGHVEIEIDSFFYGHTLIDYPVHVFADDEEKNGRFEILTMAEWKAETEGDMLTSIVIPVNRQQEGKLDSLIAAYKNQAPYDYAFFGQRCTSFSALFLSKAGIINELSEFEAISAFFYPRALRFSMVEFANHNDFRVIRKKGADCRSWEGEVCIECEY